MPAAHSSLARSINYAEYTLKQEAIDVLRHLPASSDAQLFARDKGDVSRPGSQIFIVSTPKQIFQRSVGALMNGTPANFYEGPYQKANGDESVKLALDLDMDGIDVSRPFNDDIVWTADHVGQALRNAFDIDVPRKLWIALKTDYDPLKRKHSAHLILDGFKFANVDARKFFLGNLDLVTEFSKRCQDAASPLKVRTLRSSGKKMLRLFKSSKAHKNLPFWAANIEGFVNPEDNLQFFLKTMATYTEDCQLLELPEWSLATTAVSKTQVKACPSVSQIIDAGGKSFSEPGKLFSRMLRLIDVKKWAKYDDWLSIGMNLKNIGLPGDEGRRIFEEVSKEFPGFEGSCVSKRWDGFMSNPEDTVESRKYSQVVGTGK